MNKALLIIGHSKARKGDKNFLGEYEYDFNLRIAKKSGLPYLTKDDFNYLGNVKLMNPDVICELHFNGFYKEAFGSEALITNIGSKKIADSILDQLKADFGIRKRGVKMLAINDRGYKTVSALSLLAPAAFILEPCFGDYATAESEAIFSNEERYAEILNRVLTKGKI